MALSKDEKETRETGLTSRASQGMKKSITTTKVNTPERQAEVDAWLAERPKAPNNVNMPEWAAKNPNGASNSARRMGKKSAAARAAKKAAAPVAKKAAVKKAAKPPKK